MKMDSKRWLTQDKGSFIMKNSAVAIIFLLMALSGCVYPGERWDHGGDRNGDHRGDRGDDHRGDRGSDRDGHRGGDYGVERGGDR